MNIELMIVKTFLLVFCAVLLIAFCRASVNLIKRIWNKGKINYVNC